MKRLRPKQGSEPTRRALRHLGIALRRRPETAAMADGIDAHRNALAAADDALEQAVAMRRIGTGQIEYRDTLLDKAVMALSRTVLDHVDGDRSHALFVRLFPQAPSLAMESVGDAKQEAYVTLLIDRLRTDPEVAQWADRADAIATQLQALQAAQAERKTLQLQVDRANGDRRAVINAAQEAYNLTYPALQLQFPKDPAFVETFFID